MKASLTLHSEVRCGRALLLTAAISVSTSLLLPEMHRCCAADPATVSESRSLPPGTPVLPPVTNRDAALADLSKPSGPIPFKSVIQATTGHRVLDFDTNNPAHVELRRRILQAAAVAGQRARIEGIATARANEAGNQIEPFVRAALKEAGLEARVPVNSAGHAQATGYPDVEITGPVPCYLELKTYNAKTVHTTQRSFYYSPSAQPKVTRDALHLLLAYELERVTRDAETVFVPAHWKLLTLQDLEVDLKFEFNQSNRGLYGPKPAVLEEGAVE